MTTTDTAKLQLDDILARLDDKSEKQICVLNSTTSNGWEPTLAWNPVDTLQYQNESDQVDILEKFIEKQKKAGRLVIGYLSYDFGCVLHKVSLSTEDDLKTPLFFVQAFNNWITFAGSVSTIHTQNLAFIMEVEHIMARKARKTAEKIYTTQLSPTWSRDSYNQSYAKTKAYIKAGDIYQANLTHRLEGATELRGIDLYSSLSRTSSTDFQAYIGGIDFEVISMSPERFVRIREDNIETSPIKGTRPRGQDTKHDQSLRVELTNSPKDKAELDMITDLMRNDLGAISTIGSVKVIQERVITAYPTLWHAHSVVQGKLKADISPIEALASLMPGGSITGCPKKRAMEIIDELEVKRRGIYTGSIFTIKPSGELDSSIAIRTIVKKSEKLYLSVGGGIVNDSDEQDEYEESLQKAAAFLQP